MTDALQYLTGFGGHFDSEAVPGALPKGRNSPQRPAFGLYAEQLSGTASPRRGTRTAGPGSTGCGRPPITGRSSATMARRCSRPGTVRSRWRPTACAGTRRRTCPRARTSSTAWSRCSPTAIPPTSKASPCTFTAPASRWTSRVFVDADGELLIIPQQGALDIFTEFGRIDVAPGEVALVPRGVKFRVEVDGEARGYVAENHGFRFGCPSSARSARTASPIRAISRRRPPGSRTRTSRPRSSRSRSDRCGRRRSTIRRSMSSPGTAITRRGDTISRASTRSGRSASTIPIPRSSPCSPRRATCPAAPMPTS